MFNRKSFSTKDYILLNFYVVEWKSQKTNFERNIKINVDSWIFIFYSDFLFNNFEKKNKQNKNLKKNIPLNQII